MTVAGSISPRIDRILGATRELVQRGGVRGVTIAEVARLADVGKGTLYLYWTTKEDLLADLFSHDVLAVLTDISDAVAKNPLLVAPHRLLPLVGTTLEQRPFASAVHNRDRDLLGAIATHPVFAPLTRTIGPVATLQRIFPVLRRHHVVRTDLSLETQVHATAGLLHGLHEVGNREQVAELLPGSDPYDVLADACAALLEPGTAPVSSFTVAAREVIVELGQAHASALAALHQHGLGKTPTI